jgi:hypothetical protein
MKITIWAVVFFSIFHFRGVAGQVKNWTLKECIDYAVAHNTASQALTSLKQMLQLGHGTDIEIDIVMPESESILISGSHYDPDSVYEIVSYALPSLKANEFELQA